MTDGPALTRAQRLELVAKAEARAGLVPHTKEALNLLDTAGLYHVGGGEFNYMPLVHGPGSAEVLDEWQKTDSKGGSVFYAVVSSLIRAYLEPSLSLWRGPWFDLPAASVVDVHPINTLLHTPHPKLTMSDLKTILLWSLMWDGNGYLVKRRRGQGDLTTNIDGMVEQLWPLDPAKVRPHLYGADDPRHAASNGWIDYYRLDIGRNRYAEIPPENVIQFTNGRKVSAPQLGIPTLREIALEIATDKTVARFYQAVLSHLGVPGLMVFPDWSGAGAGGSGKPISKDERDAMRQGIDSRTTGDKRGSTIVFSRPVKVEQFESNVAAMKLDHILRHIETRVSGAIGWPAILGGLAAGLDSATYANVDGLQAFATRQTLVPMMRQHGERWTLELGRDFALGGDLWLCDNYPAMQSLQEDRDALWKRVGEAFARGELTIGQHHALLDLEIPAGTDPNARYFDLQSGAQLGSLFGPALGKTDVIEIRARPAGDGRALPAGQKALPLPSAVTIDEADIDEAERDWDKWAAKHAPDLVGIMSAAVEDEADEGAEG